MKKISLLISGIFLVASFSNCNQSEKKENEAAKTDSTKATNTAAKKIRIDDDCGGMDNLLIKRDEGEAMKTDYKTFFIDASAASKHLATGVWIDGNIIVGFDDLLIKSTKKYDGVRFINSADGPNTATSFILVPTIEREPPIGGLSNHVNVWDAVFLQPSPKEEFSNYNLGEAETGRLTDKFKAIYQAPCDDNSCLSSSVWMSECVIHVLRQICEDQTNNVDGIMVFFGAYKDKSHQIPSQRALKQSTVILVPTHPSGDVHEPDWSIIKDKVEFIPKNAGFNHGELCPNSCNDDGSKSHKK